MLIIPALWEAETRQVDHLSQYGETLSQLIYKKISQAFRHMPVVPATQEAEAGELLEPRQWKMQ